MAGMYAQSFAGLKIAYHELSREFEPGRALSADLLQKKAIAAKDSRAQGLLKADADLNLWSGAQEAMPVNHVLMSRRNFDGHDMPREFGSEGEFPRRTDRRDIPS